MSSAAHAPEAGAEIKLLLFALGEEQYAIALERAQQVLPLSPVTPVPGASAHLLGVVNLQGRLLAVLDLAGFLGLPAAPEEGFVVVLRHDPPELGLLVSHVTDIVTVRHDACEALPGTSEHHPALTAQLRMEGALVGILDAERLVEEVTA